MKTLCMSLLMAIAVFGLFAQDPAQDGAAKGKAKGAFGAKGGAGKGGPGAAKGKGKAADSPAPPNVPQVLRLMRPSMYLITGHGANVVFRVAPEGVILVNTKAAAGDYKDLTEYIQGITKAPVKYVLNSAAAADASGNNDQFKTFGAEIVAGERTIKLGSEEARAMAFGTNTAIYFPTDRVLYAGDLYMPMDGAMPPPGAAAAWDALLKLDWTLAVPSQGEPAYRSVIEAYRKKLP